MKAKSFTEKRKLKTENCEVELTMKKRRKHRAGKYSINEEVNVVDSEDFIITIIQDEQTIMDVECGTNKAKLTLEKLWQGSKGQCVEFQGSWLTPNEFQYVSGRETAKDWKRSIRHQGKSIKLLLSKGYLKVTADGVNEENSNEKQTSDGRKKKRGKGSRRGRKAKSTDVETPVLVDLQGSLNGAQLPENTKDDNAEIAKDDDGKNNQSESNDESRDGNETDETIENYYSENEYSFAKENNENNENKHKSTTQTYFENTFDDDIENEGKNGTDYNQNVETETEDDNEEHISADVVHGDIKTSLGLQKTENNNEQENSFAQIDDTDGPDIFDSVKGNSSPLNEIENKLTLCETTEKLTQRLPQRNTEELSEQYEGAQTSSRMSKALEESHRHDTSADTDEPENVTTGDTPNDDKDGSGSAIDTGYGSGSAIDTGYVSGSAIDTGYGSSHSDTELLNDSMPSIVDDVANTRPNMLPFFELEQQLMKTDSPPTLIPQKMSTDDYLPEPKLDESNEGSAADKDLSTVQSDDDDLNVFKNPNKIILSLPIKNTSYIQEHSNSDKFQETERKVDTLNDDKIEAKDMVSDLSLIKVSKIKRNKRKRLPKHVQKLDKVDPVLQEKHIPAVKTQELSDSKNTFNNECTPKLKNNMQEQSDQHDLLNHKHASDDIKKPMERYHDHKSMHLPLKLSNSSKHGLCKTETSIRTTSSERGGIDVQSCMTPSVKVVAKYKVEASISTPKTSTRDIKNPLINLSSTVPRMNGEINQSKSPLQNSYDEYMRRLEASRYAVPWNPFFPYFQSGNHCNGMTSPLSSFIPPYHPLFGSTVSPQKDLFPDSLKTPMSSPLQSPYTATSPPSFEIPRLTSLPSMWNDQGSSSVAKSQLGLNYKTKTSSSDNPSSCLTIKPAHSVKPESLCSGVKRGTIDSSSPLDLSVKKTKFECNNVYSDFMGFRKHKDSSNSQYRNESSEMVHAKKHKKLKHLWINGTDSEKQEPFIRDKCTCFRDSIENWSVEQVYNFVRRLDGCSPYCEKFREHNVSGGTLQLLNTDHLIRGLGMKVGPAIVLCDAVRQEVHNSSRRSSSCLQCRSRSLRDDNKLFA